MKVIIPREYIIDGDGKDVGIDVKEITDISRQSPYSMITYGKTEKSVLIDLEVFEVCALIADALTEKDG